jgi:hypothetical protein
MPCFPVQGDLQISDDGRRFVLASSMPRLVQRIRIGWETLRGTWRWDTQIGTPLTDWEKLTIRTLKAYATQYLLSFSEVDKILELSVTQDSAGLATVTYSLTVTSGEVVSDSLGLLVIS